MQKFKSKNPKPKTIEVKTSKPNTQQPTKQLLIIQIDMVSRIKTQRQLVPFQTRTKTHK